MPGPFSATEIEQFKTDGWSCCAEDSHPRLRPKCREVHLQRSLSGGPFQRVVGDRLRSAIDHLTGTGRAIVHLSFRWWPVLFPGRAKQATSRCCTPWWSACNPQYQLKEPMQIDRADGAYSPVEEAIRAALAV
ncbi:MAG TPA: hypothetical protein VMH05_05985 [Bryobacteraceae bacterium]|nr:hypothetical protein [Bryobacteraceae bacterium]